MGLRAIGLTRFGLRGKRFPANSCESSNAFGYCSARLPGVGECRTVDEFVLQRGDNDSAALCRLFVIKRGNCRLAWISTWA